MRTGKAEKVVVLAVLEVVPDLGSKRGREVVEVGKEREKEVAFLKAQKKAKEKRKEEKKGRRRGRERGRNFLRPDKCRA